MAGHLTKIFFFAVSLIYSEATVYWIYWSYNFVILIKLGGWIYSVASQQLEWSEGGCLTSLGTQGQGFQKDMKSFSPLLNIQQAIQHGV